MPAVVLVGHDHDCPLCGPTTVDSGSESFKVNGRAVARVGDTLGCGAVITSGSPSTRRPPFAASAPPASAAISTPAQFHGAKFTPAFGKTSNAAPTCSGHSSKYF